MFWPFNSSKDDPVQKLSPELRKFLDEEAPKPNQGPSQSSPSDIVATAPVQSQLSAPPAQDTPESAAATPAIPRQSQFQDGRYAHLWKTYKPSSGAEAMSDGELVQNMTHSFQWRKQQISNIALENCAFEAIAEQECWRGGSFQRKLWMCRPETQALDRCTQLQTKFLQALGYMSSDDRPPEVEERIQMHADRLYQQMLQHEEAIKAAKEQGLPRPEFKPVMSRDNLAKVLGVQAAGYLDTAKQAEVMASKEDLSHIPDNMREKYAKTVQNMTADERLIEEAANIANARDHSGLAQTYQRFVGSRKATEDQKG